MLGRRVYFREREEAMPFLSGRARYHGGQVSEWTDEDYNGARDRAEERLSEAESSAEQLRSTSGFYPCMAANTDMSEYCPLAGMGSCLGAGSECNAEYVDGSASYRDMLGDMKYLTREFLPEDDKKRFDRLPVFSRPVEYLKQLKNRALEDLEETRTRRGIGENYEG